MDALGLVVLILLIAVFLPIWPYSRAWGYRPSGVITALLVILIFYLVFRPGVI